MELNRNVKALLIMVSNGLIGMGLTLTIAGILYWVLINFGMFMALFAAAGFVGGMLILGHTHKKQCCDRKDVPGPDDVV